MKKRKRNKKIEAAQAADRALYSRLWFEYVAEPNKKKRDKLAKQAHAAHLRLLELARSLREP